MKPIKPMSLAALSRAELEKLCDGLYDERAELFSELSKARKALEDSDRLVVRLRRENDELRGWLSSVA